MNVTKLVLEKDSNEPSIYTVKSGGVSQSASINEVKRRIHNVSFQLQIMGVRRDDSVLIICANRVEALEALLAVCNIGAVAVPVSSQLSTDGLLYIIGDVKPKAFIYDNAIDEVVASALASTCVVWIAINEAMHAGARISYRFEELATIQGGALDECDFNPSQPAVIMYSSGSTGLPKGVVRTHRILSLYAASIAELYNAKRLERIKSVPLIVPLPLCHFGGLGPCLTALYVGRPTYIMKSFTPIHYLQLVSSTRTETLVLVPSMYSLLLRESDLMTGLDLTAVKYCYTVGEASSDSLATEIAKKFGALSISAYAMTECMSGIGYTPDELEAGHVKVGSCGHQCFGELKLVDDRGQESAEFGELWVRNHTVEPCYRDATLNEKKFHDGWFRTGDMFLRDGDGYYYWRGRSDDMFVCKGNNVYPVEVETACMMHPSVSAACVAPIVDRHGMTMPAAALVVNGEIVPSTVLEYLFKKVNTRALPVFIHFVKELPTVGPGKVDRQSVAKVLQARFDTQQRT